MHTTKITDLYTEYAMEVTDAPVLYAQWLGYLLLSSVIHKNVWMENGGFMRLYPNLYLLIIGPSSVYRKSFSQKLAASLLKEISPEFRLLDCSSREAFIAEMARMDRTPSTCGLILVDEMKSFMDRCKTSPHYAGMMQEISTAFDAETLGRRTGVNEEKKIIYRVDEPFLNFSGACSFDWLTKAVETSDLTGGFLARFLWIIAPEKAHEHWPEPKSGDKMKRARILDRLNEMKDHIGQITWSPEAYTFWARWYSEFREENKGGRWDANFERMTIQVKKLAMLNACQGHRLIISREDLSDAINMVVPLVKALGGVAIGDNPEEILRQKILQYIDHRRTATRSDLLNGIRGLDKRRLDGAIETLVEAERIMVSPSKNGRGNVLRYQLKEAGVEAPLPSARRVDTPEKVPF